MSKFDIDHLKLNAELMKKKILTKKLSLRLITIFGLVFVVFIVMGLVREIINRYGVNKEIEKVKIEIEMLERKNKELAGLVEYLNTDSFKEIQARQNLGMQQEGETVVSIESMPDNVNEQMAFVNEGEREKSNMEKWWSYFFNN